MTPDLKTFHLKCIKKTEYLYLYMKSHETITCDAETYTLYSFLVLSQRYINWHSCHWMHHTRLLYSYFYKSENKFAHELSLWNVQIVYFMQNKG